MENFPSLVIDPALATLWPNTALGLMGLEARVFADTSSIWEEFERKTGPQLRKDLSWNEVEKVDLVYQEMVNMKLEQLVQSQDLAQQEVMRLRWIKVFLYGIVTR